MSTEEPWRDVPIRDASAIKKYYIALVEEIVNAHADAALKEKFGYFATALNTAILERGREQIVSDSRESARVALLAKVEELEKGMGISGAIGIRLHKMFNHGVLKWAVFTVLILYFLKDYLTPLWFSLLKLSY